MEGAEPIRPDGAWRLENVALQLVLVAGLAGAATSGWVRAGEGTGPRVAVAVGAAGPAALALCASALRRRPWPAWAAAVGHAGLLGVLAVVVAGGLGAAGRAVFGGWARLLSTVLPAPSGSDVDVLALIVAGAASATGVELALRGRAVLSPAVPAVLALVATRMVTQGAGDTRLTGAAVAMVLLAGGLALSRSGAGRLAAGLGMAAAAAVAAAVLGPGLPWAEARPAFDPRSLRDLPPLEGGAVNPLVRMRAWQSTPERLLFRARLSEPTTLRLAVLDSYDGVRFGADPRFTPAGSVLPEPPPTDPGAGTPTRPVSVEVEVAALDGPWVPAPDRAAQVRGLAVAVDRVSGVVVTPGGLRPGQRYRVVSEIATEQGARLAGAVPAGPELVGSAAAVPSGLPPELSALAADVAGSPSDPPAVRLGRLQELFRTGFSEDPARPPGHSLARLTAFLDPADRVGSTEQLAAAFAVLARSLGYPTRVAVGFRPAGRGLVDVRGADASAWPEVALVGAGWVPFDPVPPRGNAPVDDEPPEAVAAPAAPVAMTPPTAPDAEPVPPAPPPSAPDGRSWLPLAVAAAGLAGVGGLVLLAVVGSKRRRRSSRRRAPEPALRVRGAWAEAADRLVERGLGSPPSRTPRESARALARISRAAAGPLADLGDLAERAAFAGSGAVGGVDADRAWADLDLLEAALASDEGRLSSLRCAVDPRPLARRDLASSGRQRHSG